MKIPHHGIAIPSCHEFDDVRVTTTRQERHSAPCPKGSSGDGRGFDASDSFQYTDMVAYKGSDLGSSDGEAGAGGGVIGR